MVRSGRQYEPLHALCLLGEAPHRLMKRSSYVAEVSMPSTVGVDSEKGYRVAERAMPNCERTGEILENTVH